MKVSGSTLKIQGTSISLRYEYGSRCAFSHATENPETHEACPGKWDDSALGGTVVCRCPCHLERDISE